MEGTTDNTMTQWAREQIAARQALDTLTQSVAAHLGDGWNVAIMADPTKDFGHGVIAKDGMYLLLSIERTHSASPKRVTVSTWGWPKYTTTERGQPQSATVTPRDVQEASPGISVALDRGPEVIAKQIKTRFLPEYTRIYKLCLERATQSQEYHDKAKQGWSDVCALIGKSATDRRDYQRVELKNGPDLRVENRNGRAHLELDLSADMLAVLIKAFGGAK